MIAMQGHQQRMPYAVRKALDEARLEIQDVDGVAFTRGPGMNGCLSVGANAAKTLASVMRKPLVGVHHMQAHALTPRLTSATPPEFPFLTLLISGGHTMILLALSTTSFHLIANTVDSSIGNAFDKVSRELKLPWSLDEAAPPVGAGPMLEKIAALHPSSSPSPEFPIAMPGALQFSFAGLLSSVQRYVARVGPSATKDLGIQSSIAVGFQRAAVGQLEEKVGLALASCRQKGITVSTLVVSGGVASNQYLRNRLGNYLSKADVQVQYPPLALCTDNAAMIAWASIDRFLLGDTDPYSIETRPKWDLAELRSPQEGNIFDDEKQK